MEHRTDAEPVALEGGNSLAQLHHRPKLSTLSIAAQSCSGVRVKSWVAAYRMTGTPRSREMVTALHPGPDWVGYACAMCHGSSESFLRGAGGGAALGIGATHSRFLYGCGEAHRATGGSTAKYLNSRAPASARARRARRAGDDVDRLGDRRVRSSQSNWDATGPAIRRNYL